MDTTALDAISISIFAMLMFLGGIVVQLGLAQIAGYGFTPVTLSFGYISFAINKLSIIGNYQIVPRVTGKVKVINMNNGFTFENRSFILDRLVQNYPDWSERAVKSKVDRLINENFAQLKDAGSDEGKPDRAGLCVAVYRAKAPGPYKDPVFFSGLFFTFIQLILAAIPYAKFGDANILIVTVTGTLLAWATAALPQWNAARSTCRTKSTKNILLTEGNGAQHAILVLGDGLGIDLEDLANGIITPPTRLVQITTNTIAFLWLVFLVYSAGVKHHVVYLLVNGFLGFIHTIYLVANIRGAKHFGLPMTLEAVYGETKVMQTLYALEADYKGAGASLVPVFFPGRLRKDDIEKWYKLGLEMEGGVVYKRLDHMI
ncbi:hypothetical protein BDZ85DRAFT_209151 [Elsinoe ampelina]|uniref:Uncharacterized protein n=1 Tax=Elsinoe ampelina TaxID=302913 RepID=A0A6A6GNU6_9PEZI|nr:hypothetical protein BDZ85DRAFT_209151 [Elsinoe ampelina]